MPYAQEWIDPATYMGADETGRTGFRVYCTYKNDDIQNNGPREYWYSLSRTAQADTLGHGDEGVFDVRELPNPNGHDVHTDEGRKAIIREAVVGGHFDDWNYDDEDEEDDTPVQKVTDDLGFDAFRDAAAHGAYDLWTQCGGRNLSAEELCELNDVLTTFFRARR